MKVIIYMYLHSLSFTVLEYEVIIIRKKIQEKSIMREKVIFRKNMS